MIDHWHKRILQVAFVFLAIRFLAAAFLPLSADETYYWLWAQNLQLSYFDHPPLVAWLIKLSTLFLGDSAFAVRFFAPLGIFVISIIAAYYARLQTGGKAALSLVLAIQLIPLFNLGGIIITPDTPLVFFWILALVYLLKTEGRIDIRKGCILGAYVGLGLLSKYTMILFFPIALVYLIRAKHHRSWITGFVTCIFVSLMLFLPVIIWNVNNDWASFLFQLNHGTNGTGNILENTVSFIASQLGLFSLGFAYLFILWGLEKRRRISKTESVKLFATLPLLFFLPFCIFSHSEAGWTAVAYPAALWGIWVHVFRTKEIYQKFWNISLAVAAVFSLLMYLWAFGAFGQNNILDKIGKLEKETNSVLENLQEKYISLPLVAQNYQIASMFTYYMKYDNYRMKVLATANARKSQFDYWKNDVNLNNGFIWIAEHNKNVQPDMSNLSKMDCIYNHEMNPQDKRSNPEYDFLICTPQ